MEKLSNYDWGSMVKSVTNKVKQYTLNLSDLELKVEDATSNETWGPHGSVMTDIADAAFDPESYRQIMGVLARRLQEKDENWRMCYKALLLLEFLIKHGPMKLVHDVAGSTQVLERLTDFSYKDPNGKDHGVNVRHRAKELLALVNSPERVREEREKAKANRAKYVGVSASEMRSGGFGRGSSSFGGGSSSGFGGGAGSTQRTFGSSGLGGGSSGFGGGSTSFGRAGRGSSWDDAEEDYHYISKRAAAAEGSSPDPTAPDPVAATRARIDALRLSHGSSRAEAEEKAEQQRKRLTDVKVNPKIAASLGLKVVAPPPTAAPPAAAAPAHQPTAAGQDLLGGLDDLSPPPAQSGVVAAAPEVDLLASLAPAPAEPVTAGSGGWDAFADQAGVSATAAPSNGGWDAFGGDVPAAASAAPPALDQLLDIAPALASSSALAPPALHAAPTVANPKDPFATVPASAPAAADPFAPAVPLMPSRHAGSAASAAPAARGALPEDMFSDLTGLSKPAPPMGAGRGLHNDLSPSPGLGGFLPQPGGMGGGGRGAGPVVVDPRTGQPVMLVPVPMAPGQQQRQPSMGAAPGATFSFSPPQVGGVGGALGGNGASSGSAAVGGKDPFADLLG